VSGTVARVSDLKLGGPCSQQSDEVAVSPLPVGKLKSALNIAIVAPLFESVPPELYGGTERVVSFLTEELVRQGHAVTLFASGDSVTAARLHACSPQSLRLGLDSGDPFVSQLAHIVLMQEVISQAQLFDIIHFHLDHVHLPAVAGRGLPVVSTLHGRMDLPLLPEIYDHCRDMPLISISEAQRKSLPSAHWVATVHHGLPTDLLAFSPRKGTYLAFLGRISKEKRVDRAIRIACRTGLPLKIAAKVDPADVTYFNESIRPLLKAPGVELIGEIGDHEKSAFLGGALATLFPIDWPEPFGLVMIESLACGTPVIAFKGGSVMEILDHGSTGFVVDSEEEAIQAVERIETISRARCRHTFERRFSATRMAHEYVSVYRSVRSEHLHRLQSLDHAKTIEQTTVSSPSRAMVAGTAPLEPLS